MSVGGLDSQFIWAMLPVDGLGSQAVARSCYLRFLFFSVVLQTCSRLVLIIARIVSFRLDGPSTGIYADGCEYTNRCFRFFESVKGGNDSLRAKRGSLRAAICLLQMTISSQLPANLSFGLVQHYHNKMLERLSKRNRARNFACLSTSIA